ncbi:hypothetical protein MXB_2900, partial [Myxobolus squamalis]
MDSRKDSENNMFFQEKKSSNIFDWDEDEETACSLTDDTYSLQISSKSVNLNPASNKSLADPYVRSSLKSTEKNSEPLSLHKISSSFDLSQTCHKLSEFDLKSSLPNDDKQKQAYTPIKDSFKNILHKSINIDRFKLNRL